MIGLLAWCALSISPLPPFLMGSPVLLQERTCPHCGKAVPADWNFCANCGRNPETPNQCGCGFRFTGEEKFCPKCGVPRNGERAEGGGEFKILRPERGSGRVLMAEHAGGASATEILSETRKRLERYFKNPLQMVTAIKDKQDRKAEGVFESQSEDAPIRGLILVQVTEEKGFVSVLYDRAEEFAGSIDGLKKTMEANLPKGQETVRWQNVNIPNGTGTLKLPEGWQIINTTSDGTVSAQGPQGLIDLGVMAGVITPEVASQMGPTPLLVASYGDPARALEQIFPQISAQLERAGKPSIRWGRLLEQSPVTPPTGVAAFLLYEWELVQGGKSELWKSVTLVIQMPIDNMSWTFYSSGVSSPAKDFAKNLPILQEIWGGWKVSDSVYRERMRKAMQSMRETNQIIQDAIAYRNKVFDKVCEKWSEYFRGPSEQSVRDPYTGKEYKVSGYGDSVENWLRDHPDWEKLPN